LGQKMYPNQSKRLKTWMPVSTRNTEKHRKNKKKGYELAIKGSKKKLKVYDRTIVVP